MGLTDKIAELIGFMDRCKMPILERVRKDGENVEELYGRKKIPATDNADISIVFDILGAGGSTQNEIWLGVDLKGRRDILELEDIIKDMAEWENEDYEGYYKKIGSQMSVVFAEGKATMIYTETRPAPFTNQEYCSHLYDSLDEIVKLLKFRMAQLSEAEQENHVQRKDIVPVAEIVADAEEESLQRDGYDIVSLLAAIGSGELNIYSNMTQFTLSIDQGEKRKDYEASVSILVNKKLRLWVEGMDKETYGKLAPFLKENCTYKGKRRALKIELDVPVKREGIVAGDTMPPPTVQTEYTGRALGYLQGAFRQAYAPDRT